MRHMFTQALQGNNGEITEKSVYKETILENFLTIT